MDSPQEGDGKGSSGEQGSASRGKRLRKPNTLYSGNQYDLPKSPTAPPKGLSPFSTMQPLSLDKIEPLRDVLKTPLADSKRAKVPPSGSIGSLEIDVNGTHGAEPEANSSVPSFVTPKKRSTPSQKSKKASGGHDEKRGENQSSHILSWLVERKQELVGIITKQELELKEIEVQLEIMMKHNPTMKTSTPAPILSSIMGIQGFPMANPPFMNPGLLSVGGSGFMPGSTPGIHHTPGGVPKSMNRPLGSNQRNDSDSDIPLDDDFEDSPFGGKSANKKVRRSQGRPGHDSSARKLRRMPATEADKYARNVMKKLMTHRFAFPFLEPVDPVKLNIPDYFTIIKTPMDFSTIQEKITHNIYTTLEDFASDVRLVFRNCSTYNHPDSDIVKMSNTLSAIFESKWLQRPADGLMNALEPMEFTPQTVKVFTEADKHVLAEQINTLSEDDQSRVIEILRVNRPIPQGEDEIEVDIDSLDNEVLMKLEQFLKELDAEKKVPESHSNVTFEHHPSVPVVAPTQETRHVGGHEAMHSDHGVPPTNIDVGQEVVPKPAKTEPAPRPSLSVVALHQFSSESEDSSDEQEEPAPPKQETPAPVKSESEGANKTEAEEATEKITETNEPVPEKPQEEEEKEEEQPKPEPIKLLDPSEWSKLATEGDEVDKDASPNPTDDRTSALWNQFQTKKQEQELRMKQLEEHEENLRKQKEKQEELQRLEAIQKQKELEEEAARKQKEQEEALKEKERAREQARIAAQQERERLARSVANSDAALLDDISF